MENLTYKNINIIYEDNHLLVVVKPINVPSQEDESHDADMLTLLKKYLVEKYQKEGDAFLGLVHRLDRPTGGVMVFAKTSKAASRLTESIQSGDFEKKYFAIISGEAKESSARLTHYLMKNEVKNIVYTVPMTTEGAKKAVLDYKTIDKKDKTSLVSIRLLTGRSHQIRVQMSAIYNPIIGDMKYGDDFSKSVNCNLALWAYELKFTHPTTHEKMVFRAGPDSAEYPWNLYDMDYHLEININNN